MKPMLMNKLKAVTAVLIVLGMIGLAGGLYPCQMAESRTDSQKTVCDSSEEKPDLSDKQVLAILDKAIQAQSGEANLAKLSMRKFKGTSNKIGADGSVSAWEQTIQLPDRLMYVREWSEKGKKHSVTTVLNGKKGWACGENETEELDEDEITDLREVLYLCSLRTLTPLKGKTFTLTALPDTNVGNRSSAGIKVTCRGRADVELYFDKESGLLAKLQHKPDSQTGVKGSEEIFYQDYKEAENEKVARKMVVYRDGKKVKEIQITEAQVYDELDENAFAKPTPQVRPGPGKQEIPSPRPAQATNATSDPKTADKTTDLKWRPAKVAAPPGKYLVLLDPGKDDEFLPAAEAMAALHGAEVRRFDPTRLDLTLTELRKVPPRFVVFVLPRDKIDVDLSHGILEMATKVDDDPFVDFEYGFVTGFDGAAALRFVQRIEQAWKRNFGDKVTLFGSWEGSFLPSGDQMTGMKALGFTGKQSLVKAGDTEEVRLKATRQILTDCKGKDALIFMSHGYPDRMDLCFQAKNLREWKVDLSPSILFNCACFNGAPGRWFRPDGKGYEDRGVVPRDDSVALALLDSGIAGYFAGVDAWHGPLTSQVFYYVTDDGMRLGEASNAMFNRLALEFLPERIQFEPTLKQKHNSKNWWVQNQRHNGAAMILYGDPALAPFAKRAKHLLSARVESIGKDRLSVKIDVRPLVEGLPGEDFSVLPVNRLFDYYSLRTDPEKTPPQLELYRTVPLPARTDSTPAIRVVFAKSGDKDIPTGTLQVALEDTPGGKLLHIRVPLQISLFNAPRLSALIKEGLVVELEGSL
jgi:hypothetical protein